MVGTIPLLGTQKLSVPLLGTVPAEWSFYPEVVLSKNPFAYWPLTDDKVSNAPYFGGDGSNDNVAIETDSLEAAFDGDEGTAAGWAKVDGAAWTDGFGHNTIRILIDASNYVYIAINTGGTLQGLREAGGTLDFANYSGSDLTDWFHWALTWSLSADELKFYVNGSQVGGTQTGLGTFTATTEFAQAYIGAASATGEEWLGWLAHTALWTTPLGASDIATLYASGSPSAGYEDVVNGVQTANLIANWPLNEKSGTTADNYEGTAARDGTYAGTVTLADAIFADYPVADNAEGTASYDATYLGVLLADDYNRGNAGFFDGVNDYVDLSAAALDTPFDPSVGSLMMWGKLETATWTDALSHFGVIFGVNASNRLQLTKSSTNNTLAALYRANAVSVTATYTGLGGSTNWFHLLMTWDTAADELKFYVNGVQQGGTQTGLDVWAGSLSDAYTDIARWASGNRWDGWLNHVAVWNTVLGLSDVQDLAGV